MIGPQENNKKKDCLLSRVKCLYGGIYLPLDLNVTDQ